MDHTSTILLISGSPADFQAATDSLSTLPGYRTLVATTGDAASELLETVEVDLVLCDFATSERFDALRVLEHLRGSHPYVIRIPVFGGQDAQTIGSVVAHTAAYQYLTRPVLADQAYLLVKRALETRELARRHRLISRELKIDEDSALFNARQRETVRPQSFRFEKLVYVSEKMSELCNAARQAAKTSLPVLIQGETGTGKELLARAIHFNSERSASPLMVQNCGGMPDDLLGSELFGHKRGAFTGAIGDRLGLFRASDGGTVFLDEISEISPSFQVSLLRFLQEGEVKALGSDRIEHCDVRIIAASNKDLAELVEQRAFRQDLYFRLKGFQFEVPPLRERKEDVPVLADFFLQKHCGQMSRRLLGISKDLLDRLAGYSFPGNVRELENEIRRMVACAQDGEYLTVRHLSPELARLPVAPAGEHGDQVIVPQGATLPELVKSLEVQLVGKALQKHRWNQSRAARDLGISRVGLANKIRRYELPGSKS